MQRSLYVHVHRTFSVTQLGMDLTNEAKVWTYLCKLTYDVIVFYRLSSVPIIIIVAW